MNDYIIKCEKITKKYTNAGLDIPVLKDVSLNIRKGEAMSVMGPSGAGKSTLLHILGLMDRPTSGALSIDGLEETSKEEKLAKFRNGSIGFVFQFYNLLPEFSAVENVMLPLLISGQAGRSAKKKAQQLISQVGLSPRENHLPSELSGGEQQRVAIARALVNSPRIFIADEPTGNLDKQNGKIVMDMIMRLQTDYNFTLIIATHNEEVAGRCSRIIKLVDGKIM